MSNDYHDISAFLAHFGHIFPGGFRNVIDGNFAAQVRFIPNHDLRRNKADIADFQSLRVAVFINNARLFNQIRRKERLLGFNVDNIGVNIREFRASQRVMQIVQTIIKLMVAEVSNRVIQSVERFIDRVNVTVFESFCRHIIAQRAPLNQVAVIHQHAVFDFISGGMNQTCGTYQSEFFGCGILVIIEIHHVAM